MHIEFLIEDSSGAKFMSYLIPKIMGEWGAVHTWNVIAYRGIGRLPKGLGNSSDPAKRALLNQLPKLLSGYGKTPGIDAVVVVLDTDNRDRADFSAELLTEQQRCVRTPKTLFGLATEELEAWYLGDKAAILTAFPKAKKAVLNQYIQDTVCETWEVLADAVYAGGRLAVQKAGWPKPGVLKHEWANKISPMMDVDNNMSPSFCQFRDELRNLPLMFTAAK